MLWLRQSPPCAGVWLPSRGLAPWGYPGWLQHCGYQCYRDQGTARTWLQLLGKPRGLPCAPAQAVLGSQEEQEVTHSHHCAAGDIWVALDEI